MYWPRTDRHVEGQDRKRNLQSSNPRSTTLALHHGRQKWQTNLLCNWVNAAFWIRFTQIYGLLNSVFLCFYKNNYVYLHSFSIFKLSIYKFCSQQWPVKEYFFKWYEIDVLNTRTESHIDGGQCGSRKSQTSLRFKNCA